MRYQNRNSPSLYDKLKFPEFQRNSLDKQRKFWKKTQGDMWTQFKGTPIGDIPFFDINQYPFKIILEKFKDCYE